MIPRSRAGRVRKTVVHPRDAGAVDVMTFRVYRAGDVDSLRGYYHPERLVERALGRFPRVDPRLLIRRAVGMGAARCALLGVLRVVVHVSLSGG